MDQPASTVPRAGELTSLEASVRRFSSAALVALLLAVVMATVMAAGLGDVADGSTNAGEGPRLGGDYPAFYGAGSIVWEGDLDALYEAERQELAQTGLGLDGYLAFAYPPHVATAYAPLGALPFQASYLIHTLLMAAAYIAALWLLSPVVPLIKRWRLPLLAAGFTFYPLAVATGGGQNASLSVLAFAAVWRGLHEDREWLAGVAAGLTMYRPQYALPLIGLMLLSKHWKAVGSAIGTTAATWGITAAVFGMNWVSEWLDAVLPFVERDAEVNADNSISALGFFQAAFGVDSTFAFIIGLTISASAVLTLMYLWSKPHRFALADRMGAVAIGSLLISPHTNFYDAALLVIAALAILAGSNQEAAPIGLLIVGWIGALIHPLTEGVRATPMAILVFAAFVAMVAACFTSSGHREPQERSPSTASQEIGGELSHA